MQNFKVNISLPAVVCECKKRFDGNNFTVSEWIVGVVPPKGDENSIPSSDERVKLFYACVVVCKACGTEYNLCGPIISFEKVGKTD